MIQHEGGCHSVCIHLKHPNLKYRQILFTQNLFVEFDQSKIFYKAIHQYHLVNMK